MYCEPGKYLDKNKDASLPCPIGTFEHFYGSERCTPCPKGKTTIAVGSLGEEMCFCKYISLYFKHNNFQNINFMITFEFVCR